MYFCPKKCAQNYPEHYPPKQKNAHDSYLANILGDLVIASYFLNKATFNKSQA